MVSLEVIFIIDVLDQAVGRAHEARCEWEHGQVLDTRFHLILLSLRHLFDLLIQILLGQEAERGLRLLISLS